ncbi:MAG: hypothetical protein HN509_09035 [Halobacteriovoraceae bacterium]|jgi:hypothetical protein|nr:hypothetical protein [Halobacteriovoraceae bacterium]MBT5093692.1 hypothetical protein [Halobacteriovoraceae bacterium]
MKKNNGQERERLIALLGKNTGNGQFGIEEASLSSHLFELDGLFARKGGLRRGKIVEWGAPRGHYGRLAPLAFLRGEDCPPVVWVYNHKDVTVYPPAWASLGIDLSHFFFVDCKRPLPDLRPLFLDPVFPIIVLDSPSKLSPGDWSFMAAKVRENGQILFVIRPFYLKSERGNPHAHWRINSWFHSKEGVLCASPVKGSQHETVKLELNHVRNKWQDKMQQTSSLSAST